MKYLHVVENEKLTEPYIKFINTHFKKSEHLFLVIGKGLNFKLPDENNVQGMDLDNLKSIFILIRKMRKCDKILLHGLFIKKVIVVLCILPWLLKKCNWIVWGGDLYAYRNKSLTFKNKLHEYIRSFAIKRFAGVSTLVKYDYQIAKEIYNIKGKYFPAIYAGEKKIRTVSQYATQSGFENKSNINIIVGNSATKSNHHIEALKLLEKYSGENIKIYCPLSYGDSNYAQEIVDFGKLTFKDKFIPILEFMEMDEYIKFLSNMDVGIYCNDRQQGLGNIYSLIRMRKKIFLRPETAMWKEMKENHQLVVYSYEDILNLKFFEFTQFDEKSKDLNKRKMDERYDLKNRIKIWQDIFEAI